MKKVSIIVPVYNVEKYLAKCLDSLVNQTLEDVEIIVVDDGSKDNSKQIIDEFQTKYPDKIKSFVKENGGLSDARNFGLDRASGDYIGFVDSDDYIHSTFLEKMTAQIEEGAYFASERGLIVNAGHGLNIHNVAPIAKILPIAELNIGHALIAQALFIGLHAAIVQMKEAMFRARLSI